MSRIPMVQEADAADPQVVKVYEEIRSELGFGIVPNLFKAMAGNPAVLTTRWNEFRSIVLQGRLPRTLKEMMGVVISDAHGSQYAKLVHLHGLHVMGTSEDLLDQLVNDFDRCELPARQKELIRFALRSATAPHDVSADDYARLDAVDIDLEERLEVLATAGLFTAVNRFTDSIDLEVDQL